MEHHLPGLADHAQAGDGFLGRELRATAVNGGHAAALQFAQAIQNGVEIVVHEAKKHAPHHEAEARECHHGRWIKVTIAALGL